MIYSDFESILVIQMSLVRTNIKTILFAVIAKISMC